MRDLEMLIQRAEREDIRKFFLPAIDSSTHDQMIVLEDRFPGKCFSMMGLHPTSVKENFKEELQVVENWIKRKKFAAIGEIGLDFYWDETFKTQQAHAFEQQIDWALQESLPIVIHSRNAIDDCTRIVKEHQNGHLKGIFHCFSGNYEQAMAILDCGFFLGIGGVLTYKNSGLAEVISKIPLEHIVLETDAPYLSPVPFRGKRNESSYLRYVVEKLALIKNIDTEEIGRITTANAEAVFQ